VEEERRDYHVSVGEEECEVMDEANDGGGRDMQAVAASNEGGVVVWAFEISLLVRNLESKRWGMELDNVEHSVPWAWAVVVGNHL
jgi:hypothetical protein